MKFTFSPSFDRSIKSLQPRQKDDLKALCLVFLDMLATHMTIPSGMGLKRLREDFWEIRQGLQNRILFRWEDDEIIFVLAGDHDSIKEFLRNS